MSLAGLKVIEFAGLAPGPFAGLILADNGASVTRIDRPSSISSDMLCRGKRSIAITPKIPSGKDVLLRLISSADVVIDPFRPGVMEKLGLGPAIFLGDDDNEGLNTKLIYARMGGFQRNGPHKDMAGHDINYLALSGILSMLPGSPGKPAFPLNLLADFAGGGMTCALGILLALIQRGKNGRGQVVNVDMVSGTRYLASFPLLHSLVPSSPYFNTSRGANILDGGAPFYNVYTCKDGGWMSVGCIEPQFFKVFIETFLNALPNNYTLSDGWRPTADIQRDKSSWHKLQDFLEKGFMTNTRDYWGRVFHGTDSCALPVLTPMEATALDTSDTPFPAPHPKILGEQKEPSKGWTGPNLSPGQDTAVILNELGISKAQQRKLAKDGALGEHARLIVTKL